MTESVSGEAMSCPYSKATCYKASCQGCDLNKQEEKGRWYEGTAGWWNEIMLRESTSGYGCIMATREEIIEKIDEDVALELCLYCQKHDQSGDPCLVEQPCTAALVTAETIRQIYHSQGAVLKAKAGADLNKCAIVAVESLVMEEPTQKGIDGKPYIVGASGVGSAVEPLIEEK